MVFFFVTLYVKVTFTVSLLVSLYPRVSEELSNENRLTARSALK